MFSHNQIISVQLYFMSIYLSHCVYFAIMTSSCSGYELPYCTFVHDERKCSFRSLRNAELAAAPALCPVLHAQWSSSNHNHSSFLSFPFLCTVGFFHTFLSDSLTLSLIPCLLHKRSCWASCWEACPDMNHAAELTHHDGERERATSVCLALRLWPACFPVRTLS